MKLVTRFKKLTIWNKIGAISGLITILVFVLPILVPVSPDTGEGQSQSIVIHNYPAPEDKSVPEDELIVPGVSSVSIQDVFNTGCTDIPDSDFLKPLSDYSKNIIDHNKDVGSAIKCLKQLLKRGSDDAGFVLGLSYILGRGAESQDVINGCSLVNDASAVSRFYDESYFLEACSSILGLCNGINVDVLAESAFKFLNDKKTSILEKKISAGCLNKIIRNSHGNNFSKWVLGQAYSVGRGFGVNIEKSCDLLESAEKNCNPKYENTYNLLYKSELFKLRCNLCQNKNDYYSLNKAVSVLKGNNRGLWCKAKKSAQFFANCSTSSETIRRSSYELGRHYCVKSGQNGSLEDYKREGRYWLNKSIKDEKIKNEYSRCF